jgi:hypothetical protein
MTQTLYAKGFERMKLRRGTVSPNLLASTGYARWSDGGPLLSAVGCCVAGEQRRRFEARWTGRPKRTPGGNYRTLGQIPREKFPVKKRHDGPSPSIMKMSHFLDRMNRQSGLFSR